MIVLPGQAAEYEAMGTATLLLARGDDTAGHFDVIRTTFPPHGGIPSHFHRAVDEAVYVLDGRVRTTIANRTAEVPEGGFAFIPRETIHAFEYASAAPCTLLIWQTPGGGMAPFLEALAQLPPGPPDVETLGPLLARHDIHLAHE